MRQTFYFCVCIQVTDGHFGNGDVRRSSVIQQPIELKERRVFLVFCVQLITQSEYTVHCKLTEQFAETLTANKATFSVMM